MPKSQATARALNDLGHAAWFGGSLMGAIGLNGAAATITDPSERARAAGAGWMRWAPVNAAAIVASLAGGVMLARGNKGRLVAQHGVGRLSLMKTVLTAAALASTAGSGYFGSKVARAGDVAAHSPTEPSGETPPDVATAQRVLSVLQWTTPVLTGAIIVIDAKLGESQRPLQVLAGVARRARHTRKRRRQVATALEHLPTPSAHVVAGAVQRLVPDQIAEAVPFTH